MKQPLFAPGEFVEVIETEWPPNSGTKVPSTGLYERLGLPVFANGIVDTNERKDVLQDGLVGRVVVGDRCLVVAAGKFDTDGKWYYLLNNGKPRGFGWTRCGFRLKRL